MTQRHPDLMLPPIPKEFLGMYGCGTKRNLVGHTGAFPELRAVRQSGRTINLATTAALDQSRHCARMLQSTC
jgi:hypothetical protein